MYENIIVEPIGRLKTIKVEQFESKNQFRIIGNNFEALQSYDSLVVLRWNGWVILGRDWDYSRTTMKYVNHFLGYNAKEIREMIKNGIFKYDAEMH